MSLLQIVETTPSRVRGVVRLLSVMANPREDSVRELLSPSTLRSGRGAASDEEAESEDDHRSGGAMIDKVLNGCARLGLIAREDDKVFLHPSLPAEGRASSSADARLSHTVAELVFSLSNTENHDLARLIAWYLMQNPFDPPKNEEEVLRAWREVPALRAQFNLQGQSYGQFAYWMVFLGFAWAHSSAGPDRKRALAPDPTAYLKTIIPEIFGPTEYALAAVEFVRRCAETCPVLEEGRFRVAMESLTGSRLESGHLSPATSHAWMQLQEEGILRLVSASDASGFVVLSDGGKVAQVLRIKPAKRQRKVTP